MEYKVVNSTQLDADLTTVADAIREENGTTEPLEFPYGMVDAISEIGIGKTIELIDKNGIKLIGTIVDKIIKFDATPNDVRKGKTFCNDSGSLIGEKDIPSYHTTTGSCTVLPGKNFSIKILRGDRWNYTKLQGIITPFVKEGVCADKIILEDSVYHMGSIDIISNVTKNPDTQSIDLNFINESEQIYKIYYFTYKEEY